MFRLWRICGGCLMRLLRCLMMLVFLFCCSCSSGVDCSVILCCFLR